MKLKQSARGNAWGRQILNLENDPMALTIEWQKRINQWREEFKKHFYRPLGSFDLRGHVTRDQLSPEHAERQQFVAMPAGTAWGAKWEYGWFRGEVVVPAEAAGQRLALAVDVGSASVLLFVDGRAAGSRDNGRTHLTLARKAETGWRYQVLMEAYAGHAGTPCHTGPTPPDRETVPEPPPTQAVIGHNTFGIWQEDVYQLWLDVETLTALRSSLDADSLRVDTIDAALREMTLVVDFETDQQALIDSCRRGRELLSGVLACNNGSTAPTMYAFGHAHLDVAWLWPLAETERKMARTTINQLSLMEEYPEHRFIHSQPHLYTMLRDKYPELYGRLKEAVSKGQILAEGAMWVEADTNISGGESLVRQILHGKRFFRDEFGVESRMLWLPDVFGYSGALPQILKGCGVEYFSTAKIFWAYNGGDPFPHETFTWQGIDGSDVKVHLCRDYNAQTTPAHVIGRWKQRLDRSGSDSMLYPFGWGDGGGGPTREHLEFLRRQKDLEGSPKVRMASPVEYFDDRVERGWPQVTYVGELYFQAHRGTYTSQARTKRGNRKSELALREAELWSAMAAMLQGHQYPADKLRADWTAVLLNQFHDIIPGSSIARVYQEAEQAYARVQQSAGSETAAALGKLVRKSDNLALFNSLGWKRTELVPLPDGWSGATDHDNQPLPVQQVGDRLLAEVTVPGIGCTTIRPLAATGAAVATAGEEASASTVHLENDQLRIELNERGEISRILDKSADMEVAAGLCNRLRMYRDTTTAFDAWDIDSMYKDQPVALDDPAQVEVLSAGPLLAEVSVTRKIHNSLMKQRIVLRRGSRRVEFITQIDWQERHKLLKVDFPVQVHSDHALHEIQFGHIARPNHSSRSFDADRFEVSAHRWSALVEPGRGAAVLNDCKYGVNVAGNCISLTLLKSALAPDANADRGRQEFTYAFTVWQGSFMHSDVVRQGYELNCPLLTAAGDVATQSLLDVDVPNVVIDTVKLAEDGSGDLIVRLYECKGTATRCALRTGLPVESARPVNLLEERPGEALMLRGQAFDLSFRAFEILTLRLKMSGRSTI